MSGSLLQLPDAIREPCHTACRSSTLEKQVVTGAMEKLFDLRGKVALITGGSRGLGRQMVEALGGMGARLAIN